MKDAIIYIILFIIFILGLASLNGFTNDRMETKCINKGGEFYHAVNPTNSLCKLPNK